MAEFNRNVWAPWRIEYIKSIDDTVNDDGCFICSLVESPGSDDTNRVIWRDEHTITLFNRFPYTTGHLLIAPRAHVASLEDVEQVVLTELMCRVRDAQRLLTAILEPQGYNVGMNFGRCAGAGLPGHLHMHIVPRWQGDTNFMPILGDVHVIPESIEAIHAEMRKVSEKLGLPPVRD